MRTGASLIDLGISPPIGFSAKKSPDSRTRRIAGRPAAKSCAICDSAVAPCIGRMFSTLGTPPPEAQADTERTAAPRSEERRVGKERVRTIGYRWERYN